MTDTSTVVGKRLAFEEFQQRILAHGEPLSQNTSEDNLGFGWIYYALIRNVAPEFVVAIGSRRGFMPFCAARAVQDNGHGEVIFIDPSYSGGGHPGWGGGDLWSDPGEIEERIAFYGLTGWITHLKVTSEEAFSAVCERVGEPGPGIVIIDGAHTYVDSLRDFELYTSLFTEGFAVFHDSTSGWCEVPKTIHHLRCRGIPMTTIHREVGLTVVEIHDPPRVDRTWGYLCEPSNRGRQILEAVKGLFRAGDHVLDVYCGFSPLAGQLEDVELFGCDRDRVIIEALRERFPEHRWEVVDELHLPFFPDLPAEVDVLVGLGISRGHAWWDPQHVVPNVHYLLGRYRPRACLFETAEDYYGADILADLMPHLIRHGYACRDASIETDLGSFGRRRLLLAERGG